jgi:hypothetical protein
MGVCVAWPICTMAHGTPVGSRPRRPQTHITEWDHRMKSTLLTHASARRRRPTGAPEATPADARSRGVAGSV